VLNDPETMFWGRDVRQVIAYYVRERDQNGAAADIWVIQLRGFLPFEPVHPGGVVPKSSRDHITNMVRADTGRWLSASTVPQPISEP